MKTQSAISASLFRRWPKSTRYSAVFIRLLSVYCFLYQNPCYALNWNMIPTVSVGEIYSDNVRLAQKGNEKGALVTEVAPGVSVIGRTARTRLNLNYRMQNLYNAQGDGGLTTSNQLQFNSSNVLVQNKLFVNSRSTISQQNLSNTQIATDNISGSGNSTTVSTFGIAPYWTPIFGHYASARVGVNYDTFSTGSNSISNSNTLGESIQVNSGSRFGTLNWGLSFTNSESFRSAGDNVKFQNSSAIIRPYLNKYFSVFAQAGYSNNSFQSITNTNNNGFFYTFGARWAPSRHYSIEAGYGNNRYVTVYISPMQRLSWVTTYRDNSIGLNSGRTWQTALNYRTRRSIWSLTHENDTTTTQTILSNLRVFPVQDAFGNPIVNSDPNLFAINIPSLTDEVIVRRRWNFAVSYNTGKTTLSANAYNEHRVFQVSGENEKVRGISASWNWLFAPKTSIYLSPTWQETERAFSAITTSSKDRRYDIALGLNQAITRKLYGRLEVRHLNQSSDLNTNNYQENRATANLFMRF